MFSFYQRPGSHASPDTKGQYGTGSGERKGHGIQRTTCPTRTGARVLRRSSDGVSPQAGLDVGDGLRVVAEKNGVETICGRGGDIALDVIEEHDLFWAGF